MVRPIFLTKAEFDSAESCLAVVEKARQLFPSVVFEIKGNVVHVNVKTPLDLSDWENFIIQSDSPIPNEWVTEED